MSTVLVNVSWTLINSSTSGKTYRGQGTSFDTDTHTIGPYDQTVTFSTLDPAPTNVQTAVGAELWVVCSADFTRTAWVFDGGTSVTTTTEPNSLACGYTPPATCELGVASVVQLATLTGTKLTVSVTGTVHGQLLYSLDGGAEQAGAIFYNVSAGPHQVKVRDAGVAGCERLLDVDVLPPLAPPTAPAGPAQGVDLVGQPLWYTLAGQPAGALVEAELWAESAHGQDDFVRVLTLRKRVDGLGRVSFRLDTLLWPLLSAFVPAVAATTTRLCTTNLLNYYLRTTTTPLDTTVAPVQAVSPVRTALRGALPAEWQGRDYFAYRLSSAFALPPFVSWQPTGAGTQAAGQPKLITAAQPEWLFFLCPLARTDAQLRVRRAYSMTLAGVPVVDYEPLARPSARGWAQRLLAIPLAAARPGFPYIKVQVETTSGVALSQEAVYQVVEASPRSRYLLFTNSLGTTDTLRCEGRLEATLDATAEKVERPALGSDVAITADRQVSDLAASRKLKLGTGWLSPAELAWVQELVLSREVWQQGAGQLRPLDWSKRTLATYADAPTLRGLLLEFDYAYAPTAYAPALPDA